MQKYSDKQNQIIQKLLSSNIHVVGVAGIEGSDIALFLHKIGCQPEQVTLHQLNPEATFQEDFFKYNKGFSQEILQQRFQTILDSKFPINFAENYLKNVEQTDIIFAPQSWFLYDSNKPLNNHPEKISTITNLYFQLLPCPIVSVTGSNGKSTTTRLIFELINQSSQHKAWITGNDRSTPSLLLDLENISPNDFVVTETSNRQLNFLKNHKPFISVITNITENHLTEYPNFQDYIDTKLKLFQNQDSSDHLILNLDNPILEETSHKQIKPKLWTTTTNHPQHQQASCYLENETFYFQGEAIITLDEINLIGKHNHQNILQAITAAKILQIPTQEIHHTLNNFFGLPNRCQVVHKTQNITFINDREGTAVDATSQALQSLPKPIIHIFGGENKGMNTETLASHMQQQGVFPIGIDSPFTEEIKSSISSLKTTKTMTEAIKLAVETAKNNFSDQKVIILFSPGCEYGPYFNPLPGYEDSEQFNQLAQTY